MLGLIGCKTDPQPPCGPVIGEFELRAQLANDPYFANGVPPAGKEMRIEKEFCGYRIYIGTASPDALNGDILIVDGTGKITRIVTGY